MQINNMKLSLSICPEGKESKVPDKAVRYILEDAIKTYFDVSDDVDYDVLAVLHLVDGYVVLDENITRLAKTKFFEDINHNDGTDVRETRPDFDYDSLILEDYYDRGLGLSPDEFGDWIAAFNPYIEKEESIEEESIEEEKSQKEYVQIHGEVRTSMMFHVPAEAYKKFLEGELSTHDISTYVEEEVWYSNKQEHWLFWDDVYKMIDNSKNKRNDVITGEEAEWLDNVEKR